MLPGLVIPRNSAPNASAIPVLAPRRPFGMFAAAPLGPSADQATQSPPLPVGAVVPAAAAAPALASADFSGINFGANSAPTTSSAALGASLRQPFDYDAAFNSLLPPARPHSKTHNTLVDIASIIGPALMEASGNKAGANMAMENFAKRREEAAQQQFEASKLLNEWQHQDWSQQHQADLNASAPFTVGRDRLAYDPATGQTQPIYHGPADFESYAQTLGLQPGTPEYFRAAQDYVLRANGPTALKNDETIDDYRTANDRGLENLRQGNRVSLEDLRQSNRVSLHGAPTYRDTHSLPPTYHDLHPQPRGGSSGGPRRPTATDAHGNRIEWNGSAWVGADGKPVQ
jgi:hypothetical protein